MRAFAAKPGFSCLLSACLLSACLLLAAGCQSSSTIQSMPVARHPDSIVKPPKTEPSRPPARPSRTSVRPPATANPTTVETVNYNVQPIGADANTRVELTPQPGQLVVDIHSKNGRGSIVLQLLSGNMPRRVIVRLHQQKLFSLRVAAASFLVYDLNTTTNNESQQIVAMGQPTYISPDHACWVEVSLGGKDASDPVYQAILPPLLIGNPQKNDKLGLAWTGYNGPPAEPQPAVVAPVK